MHILHVIDSLAIGGAERMLVDLANAAAVDGHQVSVAITRSGDALTAELHREISVLRLDRRRRFDWAALRRLGKFARERGVDVIHAHLRSTFSFVAVGRLLGLVDSRILLHDHYGTIEIDVSVPMSFRLLRRGLAAYVGVSPDLGAWAIARAGVPAQRVAVIDNGLDLGRFERARARDLRTELAIDRETPIGVVIAGLRPDKGIDLLIAAVAAAAQARAARVLVIGGEREPGYAARCRSLVEAAGLGATITFLGERHDALEFVRGADFALLPSRTESGPLTLIEFAACGLPFVAFRCGAVGRRLAEAGLPGFVDPGAVSDFAGALDHLLALTPEERRSRGADGAAAAAALFDIRTRMPLWYSVYSRMLER